MLQRLKLICFAAVVAMSACKASAFALGGPLTAEAWQQPVIGYRIGADIETPRNLGEEYRWNTPVLYYAVDQTFLDYFGSNGTVAIDQAMAIMNSLTNVSSYSPGLNEVPLDTVRVNYRAQALRLVDVKSTALAGIVEELGLLEADRWTWCLHDREIPTGATCPIALYLVIKRNFDPVTWEPTSFVNGTLLTYTIVEFCTGPDPLADAVEFLVDPFTVANSVASKSAFVIGNFFTGLTRDDIGGLKYLMRTNNVNFESVPSTVTLVDSGGVGGGGSLQLVTSSNLVDLLTLAATNSPAQLQALFPGLLINSSTYSFQLAVTTNLVSYFTNLPFAPLGSPPTAVLGTNYSTNIVQRFSYSFANVITNSFYTNGVVFTITTNVVPAPFAPLGSAFQTNVTVKSNFTAFVHGDYYLLPTNTCGFDVLSNILTVVTPVSVTATSTNDLSSTNGIGQTFSVSTVTFFTNHNFVVLVTPCAGGSGGSSNTAPALRQGIERVRFIRRSYDSLIGRFFEPITTNYTLVAVTNSALVSQTFRRTADAPDFLFQAEDLSGSPGSQRIEYALFSRTIPHFTANSLPALAGPGIMSPSVRFSFQKVGPAFLNVGPFFIDELTQTPLARLGSFDGTTNAPIIYPSGTSIANYENQILMQITPNSLPSGTVGVPYSAQFGALGGQPPYAFSLTPGSPSLPPGLSMNGGGTISGTPLIDNTYDFSVRMTDAAARTVDVSFSIVVNPAP